MALEESAHRLTDAQVWEMDIGLCNGTPFLLWSGVGLDGFIVHRIEPRRRWEKNFAVVQYLTSAVWNATMWQGMNLKVLRNGDQVSGHFLMAVVTNIHLYAGGFAELSPNATLDDGMMDLWLFQGHSMTDIVQRAWDLWAGRHVQSDQVQRIPFREIVLESDSPLYVQLDGEPAKGKQRVEIAVRSQALRVLIPQEFVTRTVQSATCRDVRIRNEINLELPEAKTAHPSHAGLAVRAARRAQPLG